MRLLVAEYNNVWDPEQTKHNKNNNNIDDDDVDDDEFSFIVSTYVSLFNVAFYKESIP